MKWLGGNQCAKQNLSLRKRMSAKSGNIHEMENGLAEDVREKCVRFLCTYLSHFEFNSQDGLQSKMILKARFLSKLDC